MLIIILVSYNRESEFDIHVFRTVDVLKYNTKDCFKINGKQSIKMPKKGKYVRFKN